ncbi:MAG: VWA domain-containing protein [Candidatus Thiodiazotropha sp. (ex Monitilora ramsayi)]|nr:VWA domain-containing protein [Candidatus Thiodiazotropha sp. (ex Monitilora ramsayi)]
MRHTFRWLLSLISLYSIVAQAEVGLSAPSEINAGAQVKIIFSGDVGKRDFITIVPVDKPEGEYADYQYARSKSSLELRAPEDAGEYEIRYLDANPPYATRARQKLTVIPVQATVQAPDRVDAGAKFQVTWTGPDNRQDFISLSDPNGNAKQRKWITYAYTKKGSPVTLVAPDKPGTYEIQYRSGRKYYTLAKATLIVAGTEASVEAPDRVGAGQQFEVSWSGPDHGQDFIAISPKDAEVRKYHHYQYTRKGSPVTLNAPDEPGTYEVRYQTGQSYTILARRSVTVDTVTAALDGPKEVQGGSAFEVTWTGPDNAGDFIAVMEAGSDKRSSAKGGWAYSRHGSPAGLRAPLEPGLYEVRYQTGQSAKILATRSLRVTPPPMPPGHLNVMLDSAASGFGSNDAVEIILDASGSMLKKQDGRRRIEIAREVLLGLTGEVISEGTPFALRVFGHREADSCRTDLEEPLAPLDVAKVDAKIKGLQAMNLAKTPIAKSLELVAKDLATVAGERVVVLITDGEETCDGDPAAVIEALQASGIDVRVNIVGFAIDDENLKSRFRYWADLGGGDYHDATSAEDLKRSMNHALQAPYDVLDSTGMIVASGTVGDNGVELPPGDYQVQTRTTPPMQANATVVSDKRAGVVLK